MSDLSLQELFYYFKRTMMRSIHFPSSIYSITNSINSGWNKWGSNFSSCLGMSISAFKQYENNEGMKTYNLKNVSEASGRLPKTLTTSRFAWVFKLLELRCSLVSASTLTFPWIAEFIWHINYVHIWIEKILFLISKNETPFLISVTYWINRDF